jgi:hypothetical protein
MYVIYVLSSQTAHTHTRIQLEDETRKTQ